jgi:hypothetical protein
MKKSRPPKAQSGFQSEKPPDDSCAFDEIDRRILRTLQSDGLIANQTLADEIGLSPRPVSSACVGCATPVL